MKTRTTLLLLLVLVALGIFVKYESKKPNTAEARRQAQNMLNFDRDKLEGITIQNGDNRIELRRQDKKWRIEAPFKDQADAGEMETLLGSLESWPKFDTIPADEVRKDKARLDGFRLTKAKLRLKSLGKDIPPEIVFGADAALEGRMYVRFEVGDDGFLASQSV